MAVVAPRRVSTQGLAPRAGLGAAGQARSAWPHQTEDMRWTCGGRLRLAQVLDDFRNWLIESTGPSRARHLHQLISIFTLADSRVERITVRQLLNHTSGMWEVGLRQWSLPQPTSLRLAVARLDRARLAADPGQEHRYFNPNYSRRTQWGARAAGRSTRADRPVTRPPFWTRTTIRPSIWHASKRSGRTTTSHSEASTHTRAATSPARTVTPHASVHFDGPRGSRPCVSQSTFQLSETNWVPFDTQAQRRARA